MRILYLIPAPASKGILGMPELARRRDILQKHAWSGSEVIVRDTEQGPLSIESSYEEYLAIPGAMEEITKAEEEGIDTVIIGCFGDPGLDAARELVSIPIIGPAECSMHLAAMLGYSFSVLTVVENVVPLIRRIALVSGLDSRIASVRTLEIPVLSLSGAREQTLQRLLEVGKKAIQEDKADTLVLGCMSLAFLEVTDELSSRLGVPVVNPALASLKMAESLVEMRLAHSKKAFPQPPKKQLHAVE